MHSLDQHVYWFYVLRDVQRGVGQEGERGGVGMGSEKEADGFGPAEWLLPEAFQRPTVSLFVVLASFPSALLNCFAYKPQASKP